MRSIVLPGLLLATAGVLPGCVAQPATYYVPGGPYSRQQDHGARYYYGEPVAPPPSLAPIPLMPAYQPPPAPLPDPVRPTEPMPLDEPPPPIEPPPAAPDPQQDDLPLPVPDSRAPPTGARPGATARPATRAAVPPNGVPLMGFRPMRGQQGL